MNRERKYAHHGLKLHAMVEQSVFDQQLRVFLYGSDGIRMLIVGLLRWILPGHSPGSLTNGLSIS